MLRQKMKVKGKVMNKKTDVFRNTSSLIVSSSRVSLEGKDAEKLHWELPWGQSELQEGEGTAGFFYSALSTNF